MTHKILYLGLNLSKRLLEEQKGKEIFHCPVIRIIEIPQGTSSIDVAFDHLTSSTHVLFTSQTAVRLFFDYYNQRADRVSNFKDKTLIAIGQSTAGALEGLNVEPHYISSIETSEGVISLLKTIPLSGTQFFWPHSALSRNVIPQFFCENNIPMFSWPFYTTVTRYCTLQLKSLLPIVDEIIFTSPSTVDAFAELMGALPSNKKISAIGPITHQKILTHLDKRNVLNNV